MASTILLVIAMLIVPLYAWVGMKLWNWFMVPTFGLPHLGFWLTMAVMMTIRFFVGAYEDKPDDRSAEDKLIGLVVNGLLASGAAFGLGLLYKALSA